MNAYEHAVQCVIDADYETLAECAAMQAAEEFDTPAPFKSLAYDLAKAGAALMYIRLLDDVIRALDEVRS